MKDALGAARNVSKLLYKLLLWAVESFLCSEKASKRTLTENLDRKSAGEQGVIRKQEGEIVSRACFG